MDRSWAGRATVGFFAAVIAVLIIEQGLAGLLHQWQLHGLEMPSTPYDMTPEWPFDTPAVVMTCFKYGLLGLIFGLMAPGLSQPFWMPGLALGAAYGLVALFIVPQYEFLAPLGFGAPMPGHFAQQILLNTVWGWGMGSTYSLMVPLPGQR
jgi:hypothetical protein